MFVSKCPLRISLAGGSTDLEDFIQENGRGAVISFPTTLYTYITFHHDLMGYNFVSKKYVINYSKREECEQIEDIKNDVAREVLSHFNVSQATIGFTSDIFSSGSGLASSSSYVLSLIKAISHHHNLNLSDFEVCKYGLSIERKFNPFTGYQDPYGCGIGGLKRMDFRKDADPQITYLSSRIFEEFDMFLIYTGIVRDSTRILKKVRQHSRIKFLDFVDGVERSIRDTDVGSFLSLIRKGWDYKKEGNPHILGHDYINKIDFNLERDSKVLAHRLCGAGGGGYFLVFMAKNSHNADHLEAEYEHVLPASISSSGVVLGSV